jgi:hypothetical protein
MKELKKMGCGAVWICLKPTFWRNVSPPDSTQKNYPVGNWSGERGAVYNFLAMC